MRPSLTTVQFQQLANRIAEYSGFLLDGSRHRSLESALAVRMELLDIEDTRSYLSRIDPAELHQLTELVVNHETQFFRTPAHFRALHEDIFPALHRDRPANMPIRCWSAGCATGEEPYSLAMTALNTFGEVLLRPFEIYATDISAQALAKAQLGAYRGRTLTNLSPDQLGRYFTSEQDIHIVKQSVRSLVRFENHNLQADPPGWARGLDIISCQNVTIYFSVDVCRSLMGRFYDALLPGGYLFLGYSETLWRIFDRFETVEVAGTFVYRKPLARASLQPNRASRARRGTRELRLPREPQPAHDTRLRDQALREPRPRPAVRMPSAPVKQITSETLLEQGQTLFNSGAHDQALDILRRVMPDQASYPQALATIARIHADRGAWDMAAVEARRAIEVDALTSDAHLLLGMLALNQERWDEAVAYLERVRYLNPISPLPSFHLANAYRGQRRAELAVREYRSALRKLADLEASAVIDGVTVAWLRETCQRMLVQLESDRWQRR